ncbi:unnamed protein product [Paramecium octaurelia]|uniref:Uncharacterized protein n=1 Tax=Paramecium octaurelia TaxID=43137 RepID=A0A8S1YK94_PAROT|nr:unnamed protein product [Paramecium octaurelia]
MFQVTPTDSLLVHVNKTTCLNIKGDNQTKQCYQDVGGKCKMKDCTDNTDSQAHSDCNALLPELMCQKGNWMYTQDLIMVAYSGATDDCLPFTTNTGSDICTRSETCFKSRSNWNKNCLLYHADYRFKFGNTDCNYILTGPKDNLKQTQLKFSYNILSWLCSYNIGVTVSGLTNISCENYNGKASCKLKATVYYVPLALCASYTIRMVQQINQHGVSFILPYCNCNKRLDDGLCQFANNKCITTRTACIGYSLTEITSGQATYCSDLRSGNSGTVKQFANISATSPTNCFNAVVLIIPSYNDPAVIDVEASNTISSPTSEEDFNQELEVVNSIQKHVMLELYMQVILFLLYNLEMISNTFVRIYLMIQNILTCAVGKTACTEYSGSRQFMILLTNNSHTQFSLILIVQISDHLE